MDTPKLASTHSVTLPRALCVDASKPLLRKGFRMPLQHKLCGKKVKHAAHEWVERAFTIKLHKPKATLKYCSGGAVPR